MQNTYLCGSPAGQKLYPLVKALPIYDYHCHLSPREIFEDVPFENIGQVWLGGDHYKWRLMRQAGIAEKYITGDADWHEKFLKFASVIELAAGNPLYHWSAMELEMYFGVTEPLTAESAERIWQKANAAICDQKLSPRKLITRSRVAFIATTDDVTDTLEWHEKLAADTDFPVRVVPSFRTDKLLMANRADYAAYIQRLSRVSGVQVNSLTALKQAVRSRLDVFEAHGCRFTDVGIPVFPDTIGSEAQADAAFAKAVQGTPLTQEELMQFVGYMFVFLGQEYRKRELVMQLHIAAYRNASSTMFDRLGPDTGYDCIGNPVSGSDVIAVLDAIERSGGLPETILYSLNPTSHAQLISIAGSFSRVHYGAAWWFCDHKRGIAEVLEQLAEEGYLAAFPGMLTDSRSFLSYARHDYFRRILCNVLGNWVDAGELTGQAAEKVAQRICCGNLRQMLEMRGIEC